MNKRLCLKCGWGFAIAALAQSVALAQSAAPVQGAGVEPRAPKSFFSDPRATHVGDMFTVLITEAASVAQTARTKTDKTQSIAGSVSGGSAVQHQASADITSSHDGGGSVERSGTMLAKLAVYVTGVDEFGNLRIAGSQEIVINNERQTMKLAGVVRPSDIDPDNTIPSWRVSGARIELTGKGFLSRKQSPGLISRLLSYLGL
jgi:flagellar L-ring protein precursor FlgH